MHLSIHHADQEPRDIPVTDSTTMKLDDGITGASLALFALEGVAAIYLVRDDRSTEFGGAPAEDVAASIGWVSPEDHQAAIDRAGELETELKQARTAIAELERLALGYKAMQVPPAAQA